MTNIHTSSLRSADTASAWVSLALTSWFATVTISAATHSLGFLEGVKFAAAVVVGIALPYLAYRFIPSVRAVVESVGLRNLTLFHVWRVPAALLFFWYGAQGKLPFHFWLFAGVGDLLAGAIAATKFFPVPWLTYRRIHAFGFADFVSAVGTGLAFTLLHDPRMASLRELPLALIPLFGVGLSGANHLMAFDLIKRNRVTD